MDDQMKISALTWLTVTFDTDNGVQPILNSPGLITRLARSYCILTAWSTSIGGSLHHADVFVVATGLAEL
jgi:hypothetical protein